MYQKQHHLHAPAVSCSLSKIETNYTHFVVIHNTTVYDLITFDGLLIECFTKKPHCVFDRERKLFLQQNH